MARKEQRHMVVYFMVDCALDEFIFEHGILLDQQWKNYHHCASTNAFFLSPQCTLYFNAAKHQFIC